MMNQNLIKSYVNLWENIDLVKYYEEGTFAKYYSSVFKNPESMFLFIQDTVTFVGPI